MAEERSGSGDGKKTAEELLSLAEGHLNEGNFEEAIEIYKEIVKKDPLHPTLAKACNDCGVAYASLKQYDMAIGFFNTALNLSNYLMDEGVSTCYNLAQIYKTTGDDEKADEYFNRAVAIKGEHKRRDEEAKRTLSQETAGWV
ncbi:MAG: tetratricopeptide repeat protein [Euryarchaeota archaeon]|nr:tetratricopeptide repeat protein [Euryarchaeota archaeon]